MIFWPHLHVRPLFPMVSVHLSLCVIDPECPVFITLLMQCVCSRQMLTRCFSWTEFAALMADFKSQWTRVLLESAPEKNFFFCHLQTRQCTNVHGNKRLTTHQICFLIRLYLIRCWTTIRLLYHPTLTQENPNEYKKKIYCFAPPKDNPPLILN